MRACDDGRWKRRSIRVPGYDYGSAGAYFVTICAHRRRYLFGEVIDDEVWLNAYGRVVEACWQAIPDHFGHVALDAFVIMPNHVHGVLVIPGAEDGNIVGARHCRAPTAEGFGRPVAGSIPTVVRSFKSVVTRQIHEMQGTSGVPVWQRGYYEHIIRNESEWQMIREYVVGNPARWAEDEENPDKAVGGGGRSG